jgi:DNA-binding MarR family transcriptional regulator/GNAT superfamily N-acetyltransferase
MDAIQIAGKLALGSRLRRLSDYLMKQGREIYRMYELDFDPANFPVYYALSQVEQAGVMELAEELQLTHPGVIKQAKALEKDGWIVSRQDEQDKRRRWLALSEMGRAVLPRMQFVWQDIQSSLEDALTQEGNLLENLEHIERSFQREAFAAIVEKTRRARIGRQVEIIDYEERYGEDFKRINYAWIEKYFQIEEPDRKSLDRHQEYILAPGGWIFLARLGDRIIGAVALIKSEDGVYELAKMGVDEGYQGYSIGRRLAQAAIQKTRQLGGRRLFLETNRRLGPALNLYRKLGFREVTRPTKNVSDYQRSDIVMEMYV